MFARLLHLVQLRGVSLVYPPPPPAPPAFAFMTVHSTLLSCNLQGEADGFRLDLRLRSQA